MLALSCEEADRGVVVTDIPKSLDQVIINKIEKAKELIQDLKKGYANLFSTFDAGQKLISKQMNIPENLNELSNQLDQIKKAQSEIHAKMVKRGQRNKIIGVIGTIIGITGITLALLAYLIP